MNRGGVVACALLWLLACSSGARPLSPPTIAVGHDVCTACGMIISEPRFAAAIVSEQSSPLVFDDLGEAVSWLRERPVPGTSVLFVHDYPTRKWHRAADCTFVRVPGLATPMGSGLLAFAQPAVAQAFAHDRQLSVLTLEEILHAS